jgi:hypothetical protein
MKFGAMIWGLNKVSFAAVSPGIVVYAAWTVIVGVRSPLSHLY